MRLFEHFATEEYCREDTSASHGVGLEVRLPSPRSGSQLCKPQHECRESGDEQQCLTTVDTVAAGELETESPSMAFEISERLLDLHSLGIELHDAVGGTGVVWKRSGEQPGVVVELAASSSNRTDTMRFERPPRTASRYLDQIQAAAIGMLVRQPALAEVTDAVSGAAIDGRRVSPSPCIGKANLDAIAHSPTQSQP